MKLLSFLFPLMISLSAYGSVDELFLKSLRSSKNIEIINLTKKKTLSDLENKTSALFPTIDLVNTNKYGNNGINSISRKDEIDSQLALSLEHSLFQGGAEFSLNDYKKIIPKLALTQQQESISQYYSEFSSLYFRVTSYREETQTIEALLKNLRKRVKLVKSRTKIGRDRKADLYALESQLYRLEADLYASEVQLKSAIVNFSNFSGLSTSVKIDDDTDPLGLVLSSDVELDKRPELKKLQFNVESSRLEAKMEKASYYPQVDWFQTIT